MFSLVLFLASKPSFFFFYLFSSLNLNLLFMLAGSQLSSEFTCSVQSWQSSNFVYVTKVVIGLVLLQYKVIPLSLV